MGGQLSTYATVTDYTSYTHLSINTPTQNLQALVDDAEHDIDLVLPKTLYLTGAIFGIALTGATGGSFVLDILWRGVTYVSQPIMWNDLGGDVVNALQGATDQYGNALPSEVWAQPDNKYYQQSWAYGPLPSVPVVVQATNSMGRQKLATPTVVNNFLTGTNPTVTVQQLVGGGLRINPYQIPADYADALKAAVCAQAEYRDQMGPQFFARAQWQSVQGPEFKTTGKLPLIGPRVMRELSGTDIIQRGARARPGTAIGRQKVYTPVGGTPIPDDWRAI